MSSNYVQAAATAAVVLIALGIAAFIPTGVQTGTTTSAPQSVSYVAPSGLRLTLTVNTAAVRSGETFGVTVTEFNTLNAQNNMSQSSNWVIQGQLGACGDAIYPFGVSVFSGHVGSANVSQATPLQVFPFVPCPLFIRLITGYLFKPMSENATVLPGTYSVQMSGQLGLTNQYSDASPQGQALAPGSYTIAASDEWGSMVFLYVVIS